VDRGTSRTSALPSGVATVSAAAPAAATPAPAPAPAPTLAPTRALAPVVVSEVSLMPADESSRNSAQASEDVRVKPGQTIYQISVETFGKYDRKALDELRGLNPWISNPDRIRTGQKIRLPATATLSTDGQHTAERAAVAAPTEAGKQ